MWYKEDNFKVKIGGNYYINTPNIIVYKGESLFRIERAERTDLLGISFDIYNKNGEKIAVVKQGRIYEGDNERFSVEIQQDKYSLTDKKKNRLICEIKKRELAEDSELDVIANLYTKDGYLIKVTPEETNFGGNVMKNCTFTDCGAALMIN